MIEYKVGDVIAYSPFGGGERVVVVSNRDVHNGRGAFDGSLRDDPTFGVWGYDSQITRVVMLAEEVGP